ncbi:short-chain dehydrogenase/reductase family 9C member 7-like [Bacillus rossius redtenbacheri]|uniref:short-chain dehydrogenase/reductase family 9C member 7-like n=1 Tax=Bacillus rossius redtenbacheri TaxID=93214 RepID=UPI002FDC8D12
MDYSWSLFLALAAAVFGSLKGLTAIMFPGLFVDLGFCLLSVVLADLLVKLLVNTVPRRLLPGLGDRAVLITGCDSGFGQLCARRLDALGAPVLAGCLRPDGEGAATLRASCSPRLTVLPLDVTNERQVGDAVRLAEHVLQGRGLWAVINNAGIGAVGEVDWSRVELLQQVMDVNAIGVVRVTKAFLPMIKRSKGRIVCLSSQAGSFPTFGMSYYAMSKSAVQAFVESLRREMRKWSVSVHGIEPSVFKTAITSSKNIDNMLTETWKSCPKDTQSAYGEEYIKTCEEKLNSSRDLFISDRLHVVVDDMVDAALGLTPKMIYVPGLFQQFLTWGINTLPRTFLDLIHDLVLQMKKKPAALETANK